MRKTITTLASAFLFSAMAFAQTNVTYMSTEGVPTIGGQTGYYVAQSIMNEDGTVQFVLDFSGAAGITGRSLILNSNVEPYILLSVNEGANPDGSVDGGHIRRVEVTVEGTTVIANLPRPLNYDGITGDWNYGDYFTITVPEQLVYFTTSTGSRVYNSGYIFETYQVIDGFQSENRNFTIYPLTVEQGDFTQAVLANNPIEITWDYALLNLDYPEGWGGYGEVHSFLPTFDLVSIEPNETAAPITLTGFGIKEPISIVFGEEATIVSAWDENANKEIQKLSIDLSAYAAKETFVVGESYTLNIPAGYLIITDGKGVQYLSQPVGNDWTNLTNLSFTVQPDPEVVPLDDLENVTAVTFTWNNATFTAPSDVPGITWTPNIDAYGYENGVLDNFHYYLVQVVGDNGFKTYGKLTLVNTTDDKTATTYDAIEVSFPELSTLGLTGLPGGTYTVTIPEFTFVCDGEYNNPLMSFTFTTVSDLLPPASTVYPETFLVDDCLPQVITITWGQEVTITNAQRIIINVDGVATTVQGAYLSGVNYVYRVLVDGVEYTKPCVIYYDPENPENVKIWFSEQICASDEAIDVTITLPNNTVTADDMTNPNQDLVYTVIPSQGFYLVANPAGNWHFDNFQPSDYYSSEDIYDGLQVLAFWTKVNDGFEDSTPINFFVNDPTATLTIYSEDYDNDVIYQYDYKIGQEVEVLDNNMLGITLSNVPVLRGVYTIVFPENFVTYYDEDEETGEWTILGYNTTSQIQYYIRPIITGVESIDAAADSFRVYNLQGVNVLNTTDAAALRSLAPGLYIINGQKVVLK